MKIASINVLCIVNTFGFTRQWFSKNPKPGDLAMSRLKIKLIIFGRTELVTVAKV